MEWLSNFGMREWLISCGIVLVLVVLIDGFRRMRAERRGEIKMARRMGGEFPELPDDEPFSSELPNGGARVTGRSEPNFSTSEVEEEAPAMSIDKNGSEQQPSESQASISPYSSELQQASEPVQNSRPYHSETTNSQLSEQYVNQTQLIVIHAKSREEKGFNGSDLLEVLLACDCRYGDRDILHRYETVGGTEPQFSVANMVEPGTFSLEDITSFRTPGVTFFMALPGPRDAEEAFTCMIETANCLAKNLDAELLNDSHATLTSDIIDKYRGQVQAHQLASA